MIKNMFMINPILRFEREDIVCALCAFIVSLTMNLYPEDILVTTGVWVRIVAGAIIHFFLLKVGFECLQRLSQKDEKFDRGRKFYFRSFIILWIVFLLPLIIYYPGVNGWDTEYQLVDLFDGTQVMHRDSWGDYYVTYTLSDHMNLFDTFLFGAFIRFGMIIGDASVGVFIYCVLQAGLFAAVCAYIIEKLKEWGANRREVIICFLFYVLSPFIWMYSINMIKDSINAALFVLYFIMFIEILRQKKNIGIDLFFISLLVCLTKKTGIIIVVPSNLILTIVQWKNGGNKIRSFVIALSPVLVISILMQKVLYPMFNIYQDGLQETFAFSFQQVARTAKLFPASFTEAEGMIIDRVLDYKNLANIYDYNLVDSVKDTFRPTSSGMDFLNFLKLWVKTGLSHPMVYVRSLIGTNGGFFSPTHNVNIYTIFNDWGNLGVSVHMWASKARVAFYEYYEMLTNIPVLGLMFKTYFYSWILVCFTAWKSVRTKSGKLFLCFVPVYISVITFLLSPDVNARYALHIIIIAPIMFALSVSAVDGRKIYDGKECVNA